ncbi:hypothetical protein NKR23_g12019 [Pleurostoma richardsiae]|uniref:F-box domain-containing protein n=1 Tax=Pleurostoma richardsiae TaxID=41990 RepID=A0AA38VB41_9PEZI|nr:hypothetical protein NKR23_g12019 [Pleurostoma richardsiae]
MTSFGSVPTEIVGLICTSLDGEDLFSLRLACKDLSAKSLDYFAERYFTSLQILITSDNVTLLENIASHNVFRMRIRELWITPALFENNYDMDLVRFELQRPSYNPQPRMARASSTGRARGIMVQRQAEDSSGYVAKARHAAYRAAVVDHLAIATSDILRNALERSIARFPNLKTVGLRHHGADVQDLMQKKRSLKCQGWKQLYKATGCDVAVPWHMRIGPGSNVNVRALTFAALLKALGSCGSSIEIETLNTCGGSCSGLVVGDLGLTKEQCKSVLPLVRGLKSLHFCIRSHHDRRDDESYRFLLGLVVTAAPNLEELNFSQSPSHDYIVTSQQFQWLSTQVDFTRLIRLHFWGIRTPVDSLTTFLRSASRTLKWMQFHSIHLMRDHAAPDDSEEAQDEGERLWRQVWAFFHDEMSLEYLRFSSLMCNGLPLRVFDPLHGRKGLNELTNASDSAIFDAKRAHVSFREWIQQVDFERFDNDDPYFSD